MVYVSFYMMVLYIQIMCVQYRGHAYFVTLNLILFHCPNDLKYMGNLNFKIILFNKGILIGKILTYIDLMY